MLFAAALSDHFMDAQIISIDYNAKVQMRNARFYAIIKVRVLALKWSNDLLWV